MKSFEKTISVWAKIAKRIGLEKGKRWRELREFHEWCVTNIPTELAAEIGIIEGVCKNNERWGFEISAKDYAWWGIQGQKQDLDVLSVMEVKSLIADKVSNFCNSNLAKSMTLDEAKELVDSFGAASKR